MRIGREISVKAKIVSGLFLSIIILTLLGIPHYFAWPEYFDSALALNIITVVFLSVMISFLVCEYEKEKNKYVPRIIYELCYIYKWFITVSLYSICIFLIVLILLPILTQAYYAASVIFICFAVIGSIIICTEVLFEEPYDN